MYTRADRFQRVGTLIGDPDRSILGRTVIEEYMSALAAAEGPPSEQQVAIARLRAFGLSEKVNRATHVLSGGEKQRLACAVALCGEKRLFVADFSTSSLDREFRQGFLDSLKRHLENGGAAILNGLSRSDYASLGVRAALVLSPGQGEVNVRLGTLSPQDGEISEARDLASQLTPREEVRGELVVENARWKGITHAGSFRVRGGQIRVLSGKNGLGKSTLAGLVIDQREARHWFRPIARFSFERRLGGSIEYPREWFPTLSVQHPSTTILGTCLSDELPSQELIELCGLAGAVGADPRELCVAEQKLVSVANALRMATGLVLLDEPSLGMNAQFRERLVGLINHYPKLAVVIITHDPCLHNLGQFTELKEEWA